LKAAGNLFELQCAPGNRGYLEPVERSSSGLQAGPRKRYVPRSSGLFLDKNNDINLALAKLLRPQIHLTSAQKFSMYLTVNIASITEINR
jgi:hypothetical protein